MSFKRISKRQFASIKLIFSTAVFLQMKKDLGIRRDHNIYMNNHYNWGVSFVILHISMTNVVLHQSPYCDLSGRQSLPLGVAQARPSLGVLCGVWIYSFSKGFGETREDQKRTKEVCKSKKNIPEITGSELSGSVSEKWVRVALTAVILD